MPYEDVLIEDCHMHYRYARTPSPPTRPAASAQPLRNITSKGSTFAQVERTDVASDVADLRISDVKVDGVPAAPVTNL
ncbi:hypothetical protein [Nonomuraea sp. B1E8]|uniref:hypothetical protein n=1 Tax=unclassified Nonomuraea TaxID=2593643 RepID=UPI00325D2D1F